MQWAISIGHFDIAVHVMTMSSFRASPCHGHLERVKRMVGYLSKFRFAELRIPTNEPNFSDIEVAEYDWSKSVYENTSEAVPKDAPEPLGKPVTTTHYQDANLYHDIITGHPSLPFFRLDSGSSWLDGVNSILMQQEPNLLKQDYWN
jgi:hypothetical protein